MNIIGIKFIISANTKPLAPLTIPLIYYLNVQGICHIPNNSPCKNIDILTEYFLFNIGIMVPLNNPSSINELTTFPKIKNIAKPRPPDTLALGSIAAITNSGELVLLFILDILALSHSSTVPDSLILNFLLSQSISASTP